MWNSRAKSSVTSGCSRVHSRAKADKSLQHLSPFASHSQVDATSPKQTTELPSGVRFIQQPQGSAVRSISGTRRTPTDSSRLRERSISTERSCSRQREHIRRRDPSVTRDKSPDKSVRFGDQVKSKADHIDSKAETATKTTAVDRRSRNLIRPVITAESNGSKTAATSPASRGHTSPIFSSFNSEGNSKRTIGVRPSPLTEPSISARGEHQRDDKNESQIHSQYSTPLSTPESRTSLNKQAIVKTEITTPGGTVKRSTSAKTIQQRDGSNNSAMHRNTLSFPIPHTTDRRLEPNRFSVNVNVAVDLDCPDFRRNEPMREEVPQVIQTEEPVDEVDLMPAVLSDNGFALKVAVRLRPFIQSEIDTKNDIPVIEMSGNTVRIVNTDNDNYNRTEFGFDVCLNSSDKDLFEFADQDRVFHRMGEPLLEKALEGFNVCLFAYGQTGSGKSFTMMGNDHNPGIIPRFVHKLYQRMSSLPSVMFAVEVSYYEIYNEKIYDLLSDDKNHNKKILRIREHPQTGPYVENLSQHSVDNYEDVMRCLRNGNRRRATASTAANQDSSRSHSILTIILSQIKNNCDEIDFDISGSCNSRINLIDLAGSERHSGTNGDRLKEGSMINKSLLNLGVVISKLADMSAHPSKAAHIPYRDSALTWLLKESLGGNSQTSMIATISPAKCHLEETLSTLRYAATARRIINFVHINEDPKTKKIRELMEIISDLKARQRQQEIDTRERVDTKVIAESRSSKFHSKCLTSDITEPKVIEKFSKSTNTSFVSERRHSTKGTETSFKEPVEESKKKMTTSIATNTSFVETRPKTHTLSTSPIKVSKPKTASTSTSHVNYVDSATETSFIEGPSAYDMLRAQKLGEEQQVLARELRLYREKLLSAHNDCEETDYLKQTREEYGESSDPTSATSDTYFDAQEPSIESIESNKTYTIGNNEEDVWGSDQQTNDMYSANEQLESATSGEWQTDGQTVTVNDNWTEEQTEVKQVANWDCNDGNEWASGQQEEEEAKNGEANEEWDEEKEEIPQNQTESQPNEEWGTESNQPQEWEQNEGQECGAQETQPEDWDAEQSNTDWEAGDKSEEKREEEKQDDNQWDEDGNQDQGEEEDVTESKADDTGNDWADDQNQGNDWVDEQNGNTEEPAEEDWNENDNQNNTGDSWGNNWDNESNVTVRAANKKDETNNNDNWDGGW